MKNLSRRGILKAVGATGALFLPPVASLLERAHAQSPGKKRGNLVIFYASNGIMSELFRAPRYVTARDFDLAPIFSPLLPFKNDLIFIDSLAQKAARKGFIHYFTRNTLLTGAWAPANAKRALGISLDSYFAQTQGQSDLFPHLNLGVRTKSSLSWNKNFVNVPMEDSPFDLYDRLFVKPLAVNPDDLERKKTVTEALVRNASHLRNQAGSELSTRLEEYVESLRAYERRQIQYGAIKQLFSGKTLPQAPAEYNTVANNAASSYLADPMSAPEIMGSHQDLIVSALAFGLTRTATLAFPAADSHFPWLNTHSLTKSMHDTAHDHQQDRLVEPHKWVAQQYANLLSKLKATPNPDGNGTLLDHTVVLWVNDAGKNHFTEEVAFLIAGGQSLGLKLGQYLKFTRGQYSQNDLYVALLSALGEEVESFGDKEINSGALPGLV